MSVKVNLHPQFLYAMKVLSGLLHFFHEYKP
uniref:Uncharacterized protein n=1 Tax=Utricularia reniformis TaxID=192314 RepID=A0A1Y0B491_9LAMI|nr:hypothetical protein AEK19_MT2047 [Utricularia reniformis]ART32204.1 hypothetical protein AEK19_MT2047 [Utricularia reniformis]